MDCNGHRMWQPDRVRKHDGWSWLRLALRCPAVPGLSWLILVTMDEGADQADEVADESCAGDIRDNNGRLEVHDGNDWVPLVQLPNPTPPSEVRKLDKKKNRRAGDTV